MPHEAEFLWNGLGKMAERRAIAPVTRNSVKAGRWLTLRNFDGPPIKGSLHPLNSTCYGMSNPYKRAMCYGLSLILLAFAAGQWAQACG